MSVFQLGFRPFYLLASVFAIVAMIVWLRAFAGYSDTGAYLNGMVWHSHEVLFGFAAAIIAGFLLTAVKSWTGLATPTGLPLGALAVLWLAARALIFTGPSLPAAIVDVAFLPALAAAIAVPILRSSNQRNYKVLAIVIALSIVHAVFHLANLEYLQVRLSRISLFVSIDIVVILMAIVGGRIIPAFTKNAIPDSSPRHETWIEVTAFSLMIVVVLITALSGIWSPPTSLMAVLLVSVATAHAARLTLWQPARTLGNPLLWMLPVAYSWIPIGFLLRALATQHIVAPGAWIHAITTGAVGGLMIAMMIRSSRGHTGMKLVASRTDMAAFLLLQLSAITRVTASIGGGSDYRYWVFASGAMWVLAFLIFAVCYIPSLIASRSPA